MYCCLSVLLQVASKGLPYMIALFLSAVSTIHSKSKSCWCTAVCVYCLVNEDGWPWLDAQITSFEEVKFETASLLAQIYEKQVGLNVYTLGV